MKTLYLNKGKEESLRRFHPWVFSGAVHHVEGSPKEGDLVRVLTSTGEFIALGHWQIGSIAVRVLSFDDERIDHDFWVRRLRAAYGVRQAIGLTDRADNDTFRLVHGEGDNLPGLVVDIYGPTAVMQAHSVGMHVCRMEIAEALKEVLGDRLESIFYKSETTLPFKAELGQQDGFIVQSSKFRVQSSQLKVQNIPSASMSDIAVENGLRFHIDWLKGQKTGFFVDQRDNRSLLERYAKGRSVLNMFCYTGGFSVYALRGGARLVHSVDSSQKAVDLVNANVRLNFPDDARHQAFAEDAFKFLDSVPNYDLRVTTGQAAETPNSELVTRNSELVTRNSELVTRNSELSYDLIILDPPAFAKHRDAVRHAIKGYTKLNARAFEKIQPGGILFTFSCSQAISKEQFRMAVFTAAAIARRRVRILHQLHQPADHPVNIYHPEGEYLKGLVLYVE